MQRIENKKYSDDDGRSFDHLRDKNGQFRLKEVAEFLEKSASALATTVNKIASGEIKTYNSREYLDPEMHDMKRRFPSPYKDADYVKSTGENAAFGQAKNIVQRTAPEYQQTVVNNEDKQDTNNRVYTTRG